MKSLEYGEETWRSILQEAGLSKDTIFRPLEMYPDDVMKNLAAAASSIVINNNQNGGMTPEEFLHFFGTCLVRYTLSHQTQFGKLIRVLKIK